MPPAVVAKLGENGFKSKLEEGKYWMKQNLLQWRRGFPIICRPTGRRIAGVLFHVDRDYEEGVRQPKDIGYLIAPNGESLTEPLHYFDDSIQGFRDAIFADFGFVKITSFVSNRPGSQRIFWMAPADAENVDELEREVHIRSNQANEYCRMMNTAKDQLDKTRKLLDESENSKRKMDYEIGDLAEQVSALKARSRTHERRYKELEGQLNEIDAMTRQYVKSAVERGEFKGMSDIEKVNTILNKVREFSQTADKVVGKEIEREKGPDIKKLEMELDEAKAKIEELEKKKAESEKPGGVGHG